MRKIFITAFISLFYSLSTLAQNDKKEDEPIKLNEIIVTATRAQKNLKNVPITVQVVTAEDIRKSQATDFQSFLETEFAGINFTYDGGMPNINMMGFGGKYVLFLMDGERMAGETFDNIDYNRIDLDNIERIEIIKGASSSLYGSNALGGVINIITKNAKKPFEGSASYQYESIKSHKANVGVGSKQKWGSIRLTSFYNFREPYVLEDSEPLTVYKNGTAVTSEKGELNIAGFTTYGVTPKLTFNLSPKIDLSLTPNYYFSERNQGTESSRKLRDRYYNYTLSAKSNIALTESKKISLSGAFDRYDKFNYFPLLKEKEKRLNFLKDFGEEVVILRKSAGKLEESILEKCNDISIIRKNVAITLTERIKEELEDLNFLGVEFEIRFTKKDKISRDGYDAVDFLISTNPGQPLKPLQMVASGGELSRIMLALKTVFASSDDIKTLIFDEIDTGISGKTAVKVGEKLKNISKGRQVLCISHLPQIAVMADQNLFISKSTDGKTTQTNIDLLDKEGKIKEIARLIGGNGLTQGVLETAREMVQEADSRR